MAFYLSNGVRLVHNNGQIVYLITTEHCYLSLNINMRYLPVRRKEDQRKETLAP